MRRPSLLLGLAALSIAACSNDFDTTHVPPVRGSTGEEVFGIFCDRVSAQSLREDLNGSSFHAVCHKVNGAFADAVDESRLPPLTSDAVDVNGKPVSVDKQKADREHALARVNALIRRRLDLIGAIDATFPDVFVPIKDLANSDPTKSCNAPQASGEGKLGSQMADLMGRFMSLYNDGTIPQSTESLGELMNAIDASPDAQAALARLGSRQGYRPVDVALGASRPMMAYPRLRDMANATLRVISADSNPYNPSPKYDSLHRRIPEPGPAYPQFTQVLAVFQQEMRSKTADAVAPALVVTADASVGRDVLSRPRDNLEALQQVLYAQDPIFGGGSSRFIVLRDNRGYARVARPGGALPSPFVDKDKDGLADVDDLGQFVSSTGTAPPTPFFAPYAQDTLLRDPSGRALVVANGPTMYDYLDTSHSFTAALLGDLKPLMNPDQNAKHETFMDALAGAYVLLGSRDGSPLTQKAYAGDATTGGQLVTITYDAFHPETSALLDLVYAGGQIMGDSSADDTLAFTSKLMGDHPGELARVIGASLAFKAVADKHPEAKIPAKSTFWDEMIDVLVQTEKEPGLLEDVLRSLSSDASLPLNTVFADYMQYRDHLSYDRNDLNGKAWNYETKSKSDMTTPVDRTKPDTGFNRSGMQRFLQAIHDTHHVTTCNKDGAVVHAKLGGISVTMPLFGGSYKECEVFKLEDLAKFYLDSIIGKASLYLRNDTLRNGILGIGAATVGLMEESSGITGFWDGTGSKTLRPRPQYLNRQVFFDLQNDSPNSGPNYKTNHFLTDLSGLNSVGTIVCPERIINDPLPNAADASSDGKVHGLRNCAAGDSAFERDRDATIVWENFGFYSAMTPLITAYANHNREDLLLDMMEVWHRHWADDKALPTECDSTGNYKTNPRFCTKDGALTYEPLLSEALAGDFMPALNVVARILSTDGIAHCTAVDPTSHQCTSTQTFDGNAVMARTLRGLVDPDQAKAAGLKNRLGTSTSARNDGTNNPQTTAVYLLTESLNHIDSAFANYQPNGPGDDKRALQWRSARSQLVDQFLGVKGTGPQSTFAEPALPKIAPVLINMLRAQLFAHCPDSFTPPFKACTWARTEIVNNMADSVKGPLFGAFIDVMDSIRRDDPARVELEALLQYLVTAASENDALASMLASASDALQLLRDDNNLVPLFHAISPALAPSVKNAEGQYTKKSLADAQLALLARISGKYYDGNGTEICAREVDPNAIMSAVLGHLMTPIKDAKGRNSRAPLEVILDVIADVNRADPAQTDKLRAPDYKSIAQNVSSFMLDKQSGLEQFYEVVRQGTQSE